MDQHLTPRSRRQQDRRPSRLVGNQDAYDRFSATVDGPMTVLAVIWLPLLVIPLIVRLSPTASDTVDSVDYLLWALFAAEYITKLTLAPDRRRFVRTHILDLIVIVVPFLRPVRALRALRLVRSVTVLADGLTRARQVLTKHNLHFVLLAAVVIVFAAAGADLGFERHAAGSNIHNYGDALWWAVATVTTVGYGDHYPVTAAGRGVAVVLMLVGIGLVGVITANVASYFVTQETDQTLDRLTALEDRLERIEGLLQSVASRSSADTAVESQSRA